MGGKGCFFALAWGNIFFFFLGVVIGAYVVRRHCRVSYNAILVGFKGAFYITLG